MFVKNVDHCIPKRKCDEYPKEKHNKTAVGKQNRNYHSNEKQNEIPLKCLNTDFERLKVIKTLEENQRRNKQSHRNPQQSEDGKEIIDQTPRKRICHKNEKITPLKSRKKVARFWFFAKVQLSVYFQKADIQRKNHRFDDNHHLQKQNRIVGLHQLAIFIKKRFSIRVNQALKFLNFIKKAVIS